VDRVGRHLDDHVAQLVEHRAPADHQVAAAVPEVRPQVGQGRDEVRQTVGVRVARAEDRSSSTNSGTIRSASRQAAASAGWSWTRRSRVNSTTAVDTAGSRGSAGAAAGVPRLRSLAAGRTGCSAGGRVTRHRYRHLAMTDTALARFSVPVRTWFQTTFRDPTPAQTQGWPAIADGGHTLILAPTGSGKTLTAFLWAIDRLMTDPVPERAERLRVVYVSPLRALAVDVDRNLRAPLEGIRLAAERLGVEVHRPEVGVRTGDTPASERARMKRTPPDVLITTPESLYLLLTSQARETLRGVQAVIVDEIHAMAATKRGSHLALTLERLEHEVRRGGVDADAPDRPAPQRIALSATQRPLEEIARFLGGHAADGSGPRPVTIVDAGVRKPLELQVVVPVEDMGQLGEQVEAGRDVAMMSGAAAAGPARRSIWPAVHPRLLDLVLEHRSTLIFVNARRLAERLAAKLNELHAERLREAELRSSGLRGEELEAALAEPPDGPPPELVMAHHGSLSRERRLAIEDQLKSGQLRGLVATSSLELGIDMGAVDLVVQVASPGAVSRGLQRIGRSGHQVGQPSRGVLVPKYRGDLVETAVVVQRMHDGLIEATHYPRNPLDVLAQQVVAMVAVEPWTVEALGDLIRRSAPFAELSDEVLHAVLDLLAGRYPSEEFSELRPRVVWDRISGEVRARAGAQRLAVTNPGTIPDRGLYGVFLPDGARVGELDEEMVHESRPGETFVLGASTWRIEDITHDRVVVTPAPGQPGKLPFWHGDGPGRPAELGRAIGAFQRQVRAGRRRTATPRWRGCTRSTTSTPGRPATSSPTSRSRSPPRACSPTTARSWSSGSVTSSATGGCACSRRSARASTRRGRWRSSGG
jgi:ATP-dependent helicase Lhr and Lhr-like helicase